MVKMNNKQLNYIKNILIPCILLSCVTGIFTGIVIFLFEISADWVINLSTEIYSAVRLNPQYLPLLLGGALVLGLISVCTVKLLGIAKGGGIPTAVALVRGLIEFRWLRSLFATFTSALVTFFAGIPLGNEGPSVQMGTAIGRGTVKLFSSKKTAWDRYIMTGGAAAGFAAATSAPLTGIFFVLEEAHRRFSPMLFISAASAVISSATTLEILHSEFHPAHSLLPFDITVKLDIKYLYMVLVVGLLCGVTAIIFTKAHEFIGSLLNNKLSKLSIFIKIPAAFVLTALIGFFASEILGTGRSLISEMIYGNGAWYMLLIYLSVRAILLMVANNLGVTGGLFVPSLTFGAILGTICAELFIALNFISEEYYTLLVVIGMVSFLGASMRIPVTACLFAFEALGGFNNILLLTAAVTAAFIMVEVSGLSDFTSTVIKSKADAIHKGKIPHVIEVPLTVYKGSFVIDKDIRDILWPASCTMLSIERGPNKTNKIGIAEGDILTVHYTTYDPVATANEFEVLVGDQCEEIDKIMRLE